MCAKEKSEKKTVSYETVLKSLGDNYVEIERSIVNQLLLEVPNHHLTTGTYREKVWQELFEMVIPKKYCMEQGVFIIDSFGKIYLKRSIWQFLMNSIHRIYSITEKSNLYQLKLLQQWFSVKVGIQMKKELISG